MSQLSGITKNLIGAKNEVIFHVAKEYDYRYCAEVRRQEIIDVVKAAFAEKNQDNVPIYGIEKPSIKMFVTCEKLARKGVSRIPPSHLRILTEDVLKGVAPKQSVYEKDDQEALKRAMEYKGQVDAERKTDFTDRDMPDDKDGLDDKPDSDDDIGDDDD